MDYTKMACEALKVTPTKGTRGYIFNRGTGKWIPRKVDIAFGVVLPNGSTFNKSVLDPTSDLVAVLHAIRDVPMTRKEILQHVFGFDILDTNTAQYFSFKAYRHPNGGWDLRGNTKVNWRGWRTPWFAGIRKAGFVTVDEFGRWHLSGLGARVLRYHRMF